MFCPKCGSNQGDGKKFCTGCGTNLLVVSQALTGQLAPPPMNHSLPQSRFQPIERESEMKTGIMLAVLGGGYLLYKIISFIFLAPFYGWRSPFGFLGFVAFILFAIGISKIVSSRVATANSAATSLVNPSFMTNTSAPPSLPAAQRASATSPQPVFSASAMESTAPRTNELEPVRRPATSVTEDDTRHLSR
jgi:hypothetical protein